MSAFYESFIRSLLFKVDAERAHDIGISLLRLGLGIRAFRKMIAGKHAEVGLGPIKRFGLTFRNPIGVAAGFDKNAVVVNQLAALGFGFVEVGTVTLQPQPGNPKPRLFRLPDDEAILNRFGFNNDGALKIAERLARIDRECIVGVNIGKNRDVSNREAVSNYLGCFEIIHPVADYITINISSPNTPQLRELQKMEHFVKLITTIQRKNIELGAKPVLVKIAPDLADDEIDDITELCLQNNVSGIIATNTTIAREGLLTKNIEQYGEGGISGKPLRKRSTDVVARAYKAANGQIPVIGVGGIFSGEDAFAKLAAGASLLQVYTGFIYKGPLFAWQLESELAEILEKKGFGDMNDAIGVNADIADLHLPTVVPNVV